MSPTHSLSDLQPHRMRGERPRRLRHPGQDSRECEYAPWSTDLVPPVAPPLSREAAASISQVIVTLTLLLANAGSTDGFMAYSCDNMKGPMVGYELTPEAGCWMRPPVHVSPKPRDGRILWMRDKAQFSVVHCKMTETVMQANCG